MFITKKINTLVLMNKFTCFEAFAGYGGAHFGLVKANINHSVVGFSEFDPYASSIYEANHIGIKNYGDIKLINPNDLPDFNLFTGGFPCQPFSSAGSGLGINDTRGTLFHDIIRICEVKQPENILLENVKGLITKRHTHTLELIRKELIRIGYNSVHIELINTKDYGIPQNRERVWIYATKKRLTWDFSLANKKQPLKKYFCDFLDKKVDPSLYLTEKQIDRLIELHKVNLNVDKPYCLDVYNKKVKVDGICMTLTEPHHNATRVVEPMRRGKYFVRKLSTTEHFRLMGFDDGQINFGNLSYSQICKRAGNGWDINVAAMILKNIYNFYYL